METQDKDYQLTELREINDSQQLFLQEIVSSMELLEKKLETKANEIEYMSKELKNLQCENNCLLTKLSESQNMIKSLQVEKIELLDSLGGDITNRTGTALNNQIQQLESKFGQYEEQIELLEDEKNYQKFMIEQLEETNMKIQKENCNLKINLRNIMGWHGELMLVTRNYESQWLQKSEQSDKIVNDNIKIIEKLKFIKASISENYIKKPKVTKSNSKSKILKEISNEPRKHR